MIRVIFTLVSTITGAWPRLRARPGRASEAKGGSKAAQLVAKVTAKHHFTPAATQWLTRNVSVQVGDLSDACGGGYWDPSRRLVWLNSSQDEAAVHELAHAWWHYRRLGQETALIQAVQHAAEERDPRYQRVRHLAHGYIHGTPHDGWPGLLVERNDWEMFAGLASGVMGDMTKMPPYLRTFYTGLFEDCTNPWD